MADLMSEDDGASVARAQKEVLREVVDGDAAGGNFNHSCNPSDITPDVVKLDASSVKESSN